MLIYYKINEFIWINLWIHLVYLDHNKIYHNHNVHIYCIKTLQQKSILNVKNIGFYLFVSIFVIYFGHHILYSRIFAISCHCCHELPSAINYKVPNWFFFWKYIFFGFSATETLMKTKVSFIYTYRFGFWFNARLLSILLDFCGVFTIEFMKNDICFCQNADKCDFSSKSQKQTKHCNLSAPMLTITAHKSVAQTQCQKWQRCTNKLNDWLSKNSLKQIPSFFIVRSS